MQEHEKRTDGCVVEADLQSIVRLGHNNRRMVKNGGKGREGALVCPNQRNGRL